MYSKLEVAPISAPSERTPGILVVKPEARIVFASVDPVRGKIITQIKDNIVAGDTPKYLIIDLVAVSGIDATGVAWLENILIELKRDYGITTAVANPNKAVLVTLKRADLIEAIGEENIHVNLRSAVAWAQQGLDRSPEGTQGKKNGELQVEAGPESIV